MAKLVRKVKRVVVGGLLLGLVGAGGWYKVETAGGEHGPEQNFVVTKQLRLTSVLEEFQTKGYIKSAFASKVAAVLSGTKYTVEPGVYKVWSVMSSGDAVKTLRNPVRQSVRIPEERWIAQVAPILERKQVCKASEYIELCQHSEKFQDLNIPFFDSSLEGFLYPDTYNLAPGVGADWVIRRQLMNFQRRTAGLGLTKDNIRRTLIIASLLEKEASDFKEKQMIAGVIENRLLRGMKLQIDATVNYGMQIWRPLVYAEYTSVKSPFNTYLYKGLPPGPICSPTVNSIKAAMSPIKHNMVYYITMPDGITRFTATYEEHLKNVHLRDKIKAQKKR